MISGIALYMYVYCTVVIVTTLCPPPPPRSSSDSISDPPPPVRIKPPGNVRGDHHLTPLLSHGGLH